MPHPRDALSPGNAFQGRGALLGLGEEDVRLRSHRTLPRLRILLQHSLGDDFGVEQSRRVWGQATWGKREELDGKIEEKL
jgi:hypothetical protein